MRKTLQALHGCLFAHVAVAETAITWPDLIDPIAQVYEDPFHDLSYEQLEKLRVVAKAQQRLDGSVSGQLPRKEIGETN